MRRDTVVAVALGIAISLSTAGPAGAATAFVGASPTFPGTDATQFVADPGETNDVTAEEVFPSLQLQITDPGATISAGTGCTSVDPHTVRCSHSLDLGAEFDLGDGNDSLLVDWNDIDGVYRGGDGNDTIVAANVPDRFDYLFGGPGNDILRGRAGDDVLDGGPGADTLSGGTSLKSFPAGFQPPDIDRVTYATRTSDVFADTDGLADDGELLEGDLIRSDIEEIVGGSGKDVLVGTTATKGLNEKGPFFRGTTLIGGPGNDILRGGSRRNFLQGGGGNDILRGRAGHDSLLGRGGDDRLHGGRGRDLLEAGSGQDLLFARDGRVDEVHGGTGQDSAQIDRAVDRLRRVETLLP
jgi:Ca2+-binding RTX toxin-like protein